MSTSSTQVKKKTTTAAVGNIEARMVCRNDDGFQEIEYVEKMIQNTHEARTTSEDVHFVQRSRNILCTDATRSCTDV